MAKGLPLYLPYQDKSIEELVLIKTNIAGYFFDAFTSVQHNSNTTITSHPVQDGSNISDHAFLEPATLSMTIKMSDCMSGLVDGQFDGIAYTRSVAAYRILKQLQEQRMAFQVHTRLETYQNMMIESLSALDTNETQNGLTADVTLRQILIAKETAVKISRREQTTDASSNGYVNAQPVDSSILYQMFGKIL